MHAPPPRGKPPAPEAVQRSGGIGAWGRGAGGLAGCDSEAGEWRHREQGTASFRQHAYRCPGEAAAGLASAIQWGAAMPWQRVCVGVQDRIGLDRRLLAALAAGGPRRKDKWEEWGAAAAMTLVCAQPKQARGQDLASKEDSAQHRCQEQEQSGTRWRASTLVSPMCFVVVVGQGWIRGGTGPTNAPASHGSTTNASIHPSHLK